MVSLIVLFSLFLNQYVLANVELFEKPKAVVIGLETPLFSKPDINSKIIQHIKKGTPLYLHPKETQEVQDEENPTSDFYTTMDKKGRDAYVLKRHVLIHYEDKREFNQNYSPKDDTDYRLEEPLSADHFFIKKKSPFAQYLIGIGKSPSAQYPYASKIKDQSITLSQEFIFNWGNPIKNDPLSRSFFGGTIALYNSSSEILLSSYKSQERYTSLGIGAFFMYTFWRSSKVNIEATFGSLFNIVDNLVVTQINTNTGDASEKTFSTFRVLPKMTATMRFKKIIYDLDLMSGININFNLPFEYHSSGSSDQVAAWRNQESESIRNDFQVSGSFLVGIQSNY